MLELFQNIDLKGNQLIDARAENVASLSSLSASRVGAMRFFDGKPYWWTGSRNVTWGQDEWAYDDLVRSGNIGELTSFQLSTTGIANHKNTWVELLFTGNVSNRTLGTLISIGDWIDSTPRHGQLLTVTAR